MFSHIFMSLSVSSRKCFNLVRNVSVLSLTHIHIHPFLFVCSLEESSSIGQDQTLEERGVEGGAAEINCNGVIELINYTDDSNKETLRLKEDLHNANDCDVQNLKQEPSFLSSQNGDSSASQETDSCTPLTSEVSDTMVCQSSSSVDQSFSEQDIGTLQGSIQSETPCEDEQEQEHNGPLDNKGTCCADPLHQHCFPHNTFIKCIVRVRLLL